MRLAQKMDINLPITIKKNLQSIKLFHSSLPIKLNRFSTNLAYHCYLVFYVLNATNYEMDLNYNENKSILSEPRETCRIPVPVERVSLMNEEICLDEVKICKNEILLLDRCKHHLVNQVNLN
uniref:Uncharacterized protein n=1 Tax=Tetranychus urticae TaxID=32264 RepID=T1KQP8_TETUR